MAARTSEAGIPTILIEAGPGGGPIGPSGAAGLVDPVHHPLHYWSPLPEVGDAVRSAAEAPHRYWMGRGVGGGSAVNGMLIMPGDRADYDRWSEIDGCADWNAEAMAPWLAKAISELDPEPCRVDPGTVELVASFDEAFGRLGLHPGGTTLDQDRCGILAPMLATRGGRRLTVADAYLRTADPNLSIWTDRAVSDLVEQDGSVQGVLLADGEKVLASTVVLAAGTVGTARLLHKTERVRDAGRWIRNHAATALPFPWPNDAASDRPPQVHRVARWSSEILGPVVLGQPRPDLTATLMGPFPADTGGIGIVIVMASSVRSSGRLELDGETPRVVSNRLAEPEDVAVLRSAARQVVAVCQHLAELAGGEVSDAARHELDALHRLTDPEFDHWLVWHPGPVYHAVGSCRMGDRAGGGAVTTAERGRAGLIPDLDGVVVTDASLFPDLVAGGLQLPVMAVAERIAAETLLR